MKRCFISLAPPRTLRSPLGNARLLFYVLRPLAVVWSQEAPPSKGSQKPGWKFRHLHFGTTGSLPTHQAQPAGEGLPGRVMAPRWDVPRGDPALGVTCQALPSFLVEKEQVTSAKAIAVILIRQVQRTNDLLCIIYLAVRLRDGVGAQALLVSPGLCSFHHNQFLKPPPLPFPEAFSTRRPPAAPGTITERGACSRQARGVQSACGAPA